MYLKDLEEENIIKMTLEHNPRYQIMIIYKMRILILMVHLSYHQPVLLHSNTMGSMCKPSKKIIGICKNTVFALDFHFML